MKFIIRPDLPAELVIAPLDFYGPFASAVRPFSPAEDLTIYNDGAVVNVVTSIFLEDSSRYVIKLDRELDLSKITHVVYHMTAIPMYDCNNNIIPGFSKRAKIISGGGEV